MAGEILVGEQVRSAAAETAYNKKWLIGATVGPLLIGLLAASWMLAMAGRLPDELASHWNSNNEVDGYSSLWGMAAMTVGVAAGTGSIISLIAIVSRGQNLLIARIGVGVGLAFGLGVCTLMVALVAGQLDLTDSSTAQMSAPVMATGLAVAFIVACGAIWLYRPGEVDRRPNPEVVAANSTVGLECSALAAKAQERAARSQTMRVKVSMGNRAWVLSLSVGGIVAVSTYFIFPLLGLLGVVVGAITWTFCQGTAIIGPDGIKVLASGFWKVMPLDYGEIRQATVEDIKALDYGGWGYRMNGGSIGFIMGSGPALVVEAGFHQQFVISMPTVEAAAEAAALVNAYVHATSVKG